MGPVVREKKNLFFEKKSYAKMKVDTFLVNPTNMFDVINI
jgi:hypothetical protein